MKSLSKIKLRSDECNFFLEYMMVSINVHSS